jgi:hypothetical protein
LPATTYPHNLDWIVESTKNGIVEDLNHFGVITPQASIAIIELARDCDQLPLWGIRTQESRNLVRNVLFLVEDRL